MDEKRESRDEHGGSSQIACIAGIDSAMTMAVLACFGFFLPLLSLALLCPRINGTGQFLSKSNDLSDFSARHISCGAARPVSLWPSSLQEHRREEGLLPLSTIITATNDRRLGKILKSAINVQHTFTCVLPLSPSAILGTDEEVE